MNKTAKIIICILLIVIAYMVYMAKIQANEADTKMLEVEASIDEFKKLAEDQASIAEQRAAEAIEVYNKYLKAKKELEECQNSK